MASVLELILRSRKEGDAAKKTTAELGKTEAAAKKLNLGMLALKGAAVAAGLALLRSVPALLDQGIQIERAETALIAYSGSAEEAARAIHLMRDATHGSISTMNMMQNAARLMSMGLAENAEEAANLTKIATTLGATMGIGPQQSLERFTLLLANQSILRLDQFGIGADQVKGVMQELANEGIGPADRQLRFLTATMKVADEKMKILEEAGYSAYSSVDRVKAEFENLKASIATTLSDGVVPIIDKFYEMQDAMIATEEEAIRAAPTFEVYLAQKLADVGGSAMITAGYIDDLRANFDALQTSAEGTAPEIEEVASANAALALSLGDVTQAQLAKEAMEALDDAYQRGEIDLQTYKTTFSDVATNIAGMDESAIMAKIHLAELNAGFEDTGDLEGYLDGVQALGTSIGAIPDYKQSHIEVLITYREGEGGIGGGPIPIDAGGQYGLDMTVPPGFPRDSYRIGVSSGEHVRVTPTHQDNRQVFGPGANVNINDPLARETIFSYIDQYLTGG